MVIGKGLLARNFGPAFENDDTTVIFASGVSNSDEQEQSQFLRERSLLIDSLKLYYQKTFVYFSSCLVGSENTTRVYYQHKKEMEDLIISKSTDYYIFRLPQVIGRTDNPNTLINYLANKVYEQKPFVVWGKARRNVIDIDDVVKAAVYIIKNKIYKNEVTNIASPVDYSVIEIVEALENHYQKKAIYEIVERGENDNIDMEKVESVFRKLNLNFENNYISQVIKKYLPV